MKENSYIKKILNAITLAGAMGLAIFTGGCANAPTKAYLGRNYENGKAYLSIDVIDMDGIKKIWFEDDQGNKYPYEPKVPSDYNELVRKGKIQPIKGGDDSSAHFIKDPNRKYKLFIEDYKGNISSFNEGEGQSFDVIGEIKKNLPPKEREKLDKTIDRAIRHMYGGGF